MPIIRSQKRDGLKSLDNTVVGNKNKFQKGDTSRLFIKYLISVSLYSIVVHCYSVHLNVTAYTILEPIKKSLHLIMHRDKKTSLPIIIKL